MILPSLDMVRISTPCPMGWENLEGDDRTRYCGQCQLHVHNLSAMTREEAEGFLRSRSGRTCLVLTCRTDGSIVNAAAPRKPWQALAAGLLLAATSVLQACSKESKASRQPREVAEDERTFELLGYGCDSAPADSQPSLGETDYIPSEK